MYIITARRITSGLLRKPLNGLGLVMCRRYVAAMPVSTGILLTTPRFAMDGRAVIVNEAPGLLCKLGSRS